MDNPMSKLTKTEVEKMDFSWNNIIGVALIMGGIYVAYKIFKSK